MTHPSRTHPEGDRPDLAPEALERLRGDLTGEVLLPGSRAGEEVRSLWNGMIDRRPA